MLGILIAVFTGALIMCIVYQKNKARKKFEADSNSLEKPPFQSPLVEEEKFTQ